MAKLIDDPKIGDHLNSRADHLQMKYDKLQNHKDNLKQTGTQDAFNLNYNLYTKHSGRFKKEERKCENEIKICSKYLSNHDPNYGKKGNKTN